MIQTIYWVLAVLVMLVFLVNGIYMLVTSIKNNKEYKEIMSLYPSIIKCSEKTQEDFKKYVEGRIEAKKEEPRPHKFKVGDRVIGNIKANKYGITTKGWIGTVQETDNYGFTADGYMYLDYACFDLYEEREGK